MSETNLKGNQLSPEQAEQVGGALSLSCSPEDISKVIDDLKDNYDKIVDFASYVIGRVAGETPPNP